MLLNGDSPIMSAGHDSVSDVIYRFNSINHEIYCFLLFSVLKQSILINLSFTIIFYRFLSDFYQIFIVYYQISIKFLLYSIKFYRFRSIQYVRGFLQLSNHISLQKFPILYRVDRRQTGNRHYHLPLNLTGGCQVCDVFFEGLSKTVILA